MYMSKLRYFHYWTSTTWCASHVSFGSKRYYAHWLTSQALTLYELFNHCSELRRVNQICGFVTQFHLVFIIFALILLFSVFMSRLLNVWYERKKFVSQIPFVVVLCSGWFILCMSLPFFFFFVRSVPVVNGSNRVTCYILIQSITRLIFQIFCTTYKYSILIRKHINMKSMIVIQE